MSAVTNAAVQTISKTRKLAKVKPLGRFWRMVERLRCETPPVAVSKAYKAAWCRPELSVTARYLKGSDKLRHATLSGLR